MLVISSHTIIFNSQKTAIMMIRVTLKRLGLVDIVDNPGLTHPV